ncbi:MAG: NAD kinase [Bacteroidia bacterium]
MKIAIYGRLTDNTDITTLCRFFEYLKVVQIQAQMYAPYYQAIQEKYAGILSFYEIPLFEQAIEIGKVKIIYSMGGDGTVLECVRLFGKLQKPIFGVNFGRLGYLTCITQDDLIQATEDLRRDMYRIDERDLLSVVSDPPGIFGEENFGLNDLTLHKSHTNEMITVHTYVNGEFLNSYKGDGLIIATPTGSTAYSLACGGPIIFPASENFIITPVAPHSLTVRPVIIPNTCVVSCEVVSRSGQAMVALDTQTKIIQPNMALAIRKADWRVQLVRLYDTKYVATLRRTLMWGNDARK